jgi:hypothetical protein
MILAAFRYDVITDLGAADSSHLPFQMRKYKKKSFVRKKMFTFARILTTLAYAR